MAIPVIYSFRSVKLRWWSNFIAILAVAGVVAVFIAILSMAKGFQSTLIESGSQKNAMVRRGGATSEMDSFIVLEDIKVMSDAPQVMRGVDGRALASPEVVVVAAFPHKASQADALCQIRGVTDRALAVHEKVKITKGRFFNPGLPEMVVGVEAARIYEGLALGSQIEMGGRKWSIVGIMNSLGSAFDSEVWMDAVMLTDTYKRPKDMFSSLTLRFNSSSDFDVLKENFLSDPRLTVQVDREIEYYRKQSRGLTTMIHVLGYLIAFVMGIGAVFGAVNTMYSTISERIRELATLRALGFSAFSVMMAMMAESLIIAMIGGFMGAILVLPLNGFTASTLNWQTFSQIAFAFKITPDLIGMGLMFSFLMGLLGGFLPSIRAARLPVATALREL